MSAGRLLLVVIVVAAIVGGIAWQQGLLKFGPEGLTVDHQKAGEEVDLYTRAAAEYQAVQYKAAYDDFKAALAKLPNDARAEEAAFKLGKCLEEIRKPDEALQAYKDFVAKYPDSEQVATAKQRIEKLALLSGH